MKRLYHLIGIIILAIILLKADFQKIASQFSVFNPWFFILINLLILPGLFLRSYRWRYLLRQQGIEYSLKDSFLSYIGGIYAGIVTPGRAGETVKALYLKRDKNVPFAEAMAGIFIDRLLDFYLLVLLGSMAFFQSLDMKGANSMIFISLVVIFLLSVPFLFLNTPLLEKIAKMLYKNAIFKIDNNLFEGQFKSFFSAIKKIIAKGIYAPFILTIAAYLFYFCQCYLLARLISVNIPFFVIASFVSISSLFSLLPITVLGIGTREASLIYLFSLRGIKAENALAYSFLLFFSFYIISGLLAFSGWLIKGKGMIDKNG